MLRTMNIVSTADLRRTYGEGETAVHALAGVTLSLPGRPVHGDHGPVGLRQVDADAPAGRARQADVGLGRDRRAGARRPRRQGPHAAAARPPRLRLPGLQPRAGADRRGEHHAAADARGPQARPGVARPADRHRRPARPPHAPARRSSPAASSSASPWRARSCTGPPWCSPTSRPATWTRTPPRRCWACCARPSTSSTRR